jgi:hypothetical protein
MPFATPCSTRWGSGSRRTRPPGRTPRSGSRRVVPSDLDHQGVDDRPRWPPRDGPRATARPGRCAATPAATVALLAAARPASERTTQRPRLAGPTAATRTTLPARARQKRPRPSRPPLDSPLLPLRPHHHHQRLGRSYPHQVKTSCPRPSRLPPAAAPPACAKRCPHEALYPRGRTRAAGPLRGPAALRGAPTGRGDR